MSTFKISKEADEEFDIAISFTNQNPDVTYIVQSIVSATATLNGVDVSASILDAAKQSVSGNQAIIWVRNGVVGNAYDIEVLALMTTGQTLNKCILLTVEDCT